ncbi:MAG TPA: LLM class flavin-dependent oxidoreductase [Jatrophihabitantaceae bacterium]
MRVGLALLPEVNPAEDDRWSRADQLGFAHAWCFDHLAWRSLADSPWHATVAVLAAAAMTTSRIPLGTFVASPNFRHPVPFGKELMTLDVMSDGRLVVGIGAGGPGFDAAVLGGPSLSPGKRQIRFEEFVIVLDLLLRQPRTSWDGSHFRAVDARTVPGPVQRPRPPFVIAGNGPRGMRLALTHGEGWATMGTAPHGSDPETWWRGVADAAARFDELSVHMTAPPTGFRRYLDLMALAGPADSAEQLHDDAGRAAELGFTDIVVPWPRPSEPFAGRVEVIEQLADRLTDGELD